MIIFSHGSSNSRGVAIVIKNGSNITFDDVFKDDFGRILMVKGDKNDFKFTLVNIYAPNNEQMLAKFYLDLNDTFLTQNFDINDNIIIGGDFNSILNVDLDKSGGILKLKENVVDNINTIKDVFDLVDVWRFYHPTEHRYTWRQNRPLIQCRLDYFLISNNLLEYVKLSDIIPGIRTDHSAILINLQLQNNPKRGSGHWKFNNSYLEDEVYISELNNL